MPIRKHFFTPQGYYHIFNRGHNKQQIFFLYKDYQRYLKRAKEYLEKHPVTIITYCLMPNHIHLLLRQEGEESIDRFIHRLHTAYTMYFNKKYNRVGAVFQGRYKAKQIETDEYLLHVSRYIHQNPIEILRAQGPALKLKLEEYPWSSYEEYVKSVIAPLCNTEIVLDQFPKSKQKLRYRRFVEEGIDDLDQSLFTALNAGVIPEMTITQSSPLKARP